MTRSRWPQIVAVVLACGAVVGIAITANIVRSEGLDGLWRRKKDLIQSVRPEAKPLIEEAEKALR